MDKGESNFDSSSEGKVASKINEIRSVISVGDLDEAFFLAKKNFKETRFGNDIISLTSRFNNLEADRVKGIVSSDDENLRRNKITESTLVLLSKIERSFKDKIKRIPDHERNQVIEEVLNN